MKKIGILVLILVTAFCYNACKTEDDVVFVAQDASGINFTNNFSSEYILTPATAGNLGERFTWDDADFGQPTNVSYELQKSNSSDFSDFTIINTSTGNELSITIGDMLGYAGTLGLDADPATPEPNSGSIFVRLMASLGTNGGNGVFSEVKELILVLPEAVGNEINCDLDQLWLVGAGVPFAGWGWETPNKISCTGNGVYSGNITFSNEGDANFRFFTVETDWGSGRNYTFYVDEGYTIDSNFEDALDGDNNFKFVGDSGLHYLEVDTINKTITLGEPQALGDCELEQLWIVGAGVPDAGWGWDSPVQTMCDGEGVYSGFVNFTSDGDANFRFFTVETDWGSGRNFPYYADAGYTIDAVFENAGDGDNNFKFVGTTGAYYLTVDDINKIISVE
ncbi:SusE domain-containing protein [Ulvibacter antarcticus]|uniref:SusE-like outer membrane protein n=1 Tax=Ulvibacter antarcticus TaxID=442714 RepID=A0A3L9YHZ8_9FLAO|nr:SusE domain-containing protein [Ulvibacter antarcticus]RMA58829.1 SusE-like outer membrane protein [Ulvibacter antarcticus]